MNPKYSVIHQFEPGVYLLGLYEGSTKGVNFKNMFVKRRGSAIHERGFSDERDVAAIGESLVDRFKGEFIEYIEGIAYFAKFPRDKMEELVQDLHSRRYSEPIQQSTRP